MATEPAGKNHDKHVIYAHAVGHPDAAGRRTADREFQEGLSAAQEYARRNGGIGGLDDLAGVDHPLCAWIAQQRLCQLEDRLPENRRAVLESIDGWQWTQPRHPGSQ